jgi:hypothetical protein
MDSAGFIQVIVTGGALITFVVQQWFKGRTDRDAQRAAAEALKAASSAQLAQTVAAAELLRAQAHAAAVELDLAQERRTLETRRLADLAVSKVRAEAVAHTNELKVAIAENTDINQQALLAANNMNVKIAENQQTIVDNQHDVVGLAGQQNRIEELGKDTNLRVRDITEVVVKKAV